MAKKEVGITLALGGEKEYTQGFSNAVKVTKMLQAETKALRRNLKEAQTPCRPCSLSRKT